MDKADNLSQALEGMVGIEYAQRVDEVEEPFRANLINYLFRDSHRWSRQGLQTLIEKTVRYFGHRD